MPVNQTFNSAAPGFATGPQTPISADYLQAPFSARVGVWLTTGSTASYSIEWTADDVNNANLTPRWFGDSALPAGTTASGTTVYTSPIAFVRANISALSGVLELKFLQGQTSGGW